MKLGIMQPYFFPYLGYFQLLNAVDKYVIYDNIQYTKKGWFNRNRYLCDGVDKSFTIPIEKASSYLDVKERKVAESFDREKLKKQIKAAYQKAPYFEKVFALFCDCIDYKDDNLFEYIYYSVKKIAEYVGITTEIIISSSIDIDHDELKGKDKVIAICEALQADQYYNPVGGMELYNKKEFEDKEIRLSFIRMNSDIIYKQFNNEFVPGLSILDVMMFNSIDDIRCMLEWYELL